MTALEPILIVKTEETAQLLQQLAIEQAEVVRVRSRVEVEEATVKRQAEAVAELQAGAQTEVEEAMPILENAIRALDALDKKVRLRLSPASVLLCLKHEPFCLRGECPSIRDGDGHW